jgi:NADH-quinone oxidoreductase subunit J
VSTSYAHVLTPAAAQVITHTRPGESAVFYLMGLVAIVAALGVVFSKNAVHAAISLVGVLFSFAVFYAMQDAPFLAVVQVIVYAGAILMLFLFVLMLVGVDSSDSLVETIRGHRLATAGFGMTFVAILVGTIGHTIVHTQAVGLTSANAGGNVQALARLIFTTYFWPFEVISALLIVAAVGAMVLAHRERTEEKPTQAQLMRERFRQPEPRTAHSAPGVFAAGDSADRPALLPSGAPDRSSVYDELRGGEAAHEHVTENTP